MTASIYMTKGRRRVLDALASPATQRELSERLGVTRDVASRAVNALQAAGLVKPAGCRPAVGKGVRPLLWVRTGERAR